MKNGIAFFIMLFVALQVNGQGKAPAKESSCYDDWYSVFRSRGANPVADGTHQVVIGVRKEGSSKCFAGKVDVKGGLIVPPVLIENVDGTFETLGTDYQLTPAYKTAAATDLFKIVNGMSVTALSTDQEEVKVFFINSIKEKPKARKAAAGPPPGSM